MMSEIKTNKLQNKIWWYGIAMLPILHTKYDEVGDKDWQITKSNMMKREGNVADITYNV